MWKFMQFSDMIFLTQTSEELGLTPLTTGSIHDVVGRILVQTITDPAHSAAVNATLIGWLLLTTLLRMSTP